MDEEAKFWSLTVQVIYDQTKDFDHEWKPRSPLMWVIAALLFPFNRRFMDGYVTTVGKTVYWPTKDYGKRPGAWKTLAHEYVHVWDWMQSPLLFLARYLFPQGLALLALFALLAFVSKWFLLALLFLGFAAPWPSMGRALIEHRGYAMTIAVELWSEGSISDARMEEIARQFTGWAYYRMQPNRDAVMAELWGVMRKVESGEIRRGPLSEPYGEVYDWMERNGLLHGQE